MRILTHLPVATFIRSQWFTLSLAFLAFAAWLWPEAGGQLSAGGWTQSAAIALVFFLMGLSIPAREAMGAAAHWRFHLFAFAFIYGICPLLGWSAMQLWSERLPEGLVIGFYLLSALPTTITSCVVFTQLSGGNAAATLFSAVAANFAGILISPGLLLLMIGTADGSVDLEIGPILTKLGSLVIVPFIIGHGAQWRAGNRLAPLARRASLINSLCVLLIAYFAFCQMFLSPEVAQWGSRLVYPLLTLLPAHGLLLCAAWAGARACGLNRRDRIAMVFCAPQKTLALGLPLIAASLAARPDLIGLASLPIIIYHPLQLLVAGLLKAPLSRLAVQSGRS